MSVAKKFPKTCPSRCVTNETPELFTFAFVAEWKVVKRRRRRYRHRRRRC